LSGSFTVLSKLMRPACLQAAGRLRKLGKGQRLRIAGTPDVSAKILHSATAAAASAAAPSGSAPARKCAHGRASASQVARAGTQPDAVTSREVLQWVMGNTVGATLRGLLEFSKQGLLFATTRGAPERTLQPEVLALEELYGASRRHRPLPAVVRQASEQRLAGASLAGDMGELVGSLAQRAEEYGSGHSVLAHGGLGEECERELEREEEKEEEVERQVPRIAAAAETDWEYSQALGATSLADLVARTRLQLLPLADLAAQLQPAGLADLPWSRLVFATPNFARATEQPEGEAANEYQRAVDALLLLPATAEAAAAAVAGSACGGGSRAEGKPGERGLAVLLLSERECNALLELLWQAGCGGAASGTRKESPPPLLANLCYACEVQQQPVNGAAPAPLRLAAPVFAGSSLAAGGGLLEAELQQGGFMPQLVSLQLWNGETTYIDKCLPPDGGWEALRQELQQLHSMVCGHDALAEALVCMRGKQPFYSLSQLERACDRRNAGSGGGGRGRRK
jgi:hypothetical protein